MEHKGVSKEKDFSTKIIDLDIPRGLKIFLSGSWLIFVIMGHLFLSFFKFFNLDNDIPKSSEQKQLEEEEEYYRRRREEEEEQDYLQQYYLRIEEENYYNEMWHMHNDYYSDNDSSDN